MENTALATPNFKSFTRDENGLLSTVEYIYNLDGSINWRKMIKPEFLVPNAERTQETDLTKVKDNEMLILLGGLKYLAALRGFSDLSFKVEACGTGYCCVKCRIGWVPNYETGMEEVYFESIADAHERNTDPNMGANFLASIAENRAFVRCVRNFLKINIPGKDEMKGDAQVSVESTEPPAGPPSPASRLSALMIEKNVTFPKIKATLKKEGLLEAEDYESVKDIPSPRIFDLIGRLQKIEKS